MKKLKWIVSTVALGAVAMAYADCIVNRVMADGCYRNMTVSSTQGCPQTIDLNPYGIGTSGQLSGGYYWWVTTSGAPRQGHEDWQDASGNVYCVYNYWDPQSGSYSTIALPVGTRVEQRVENTATHTCNF